MQPYENYDEKEKKLIRNALEVSVSEERMKEFCKKMNEKVDSARASDKFKTW